MSQAVAEYTIDGARLGSEPYRFASASRAETRLEKKQGEVFLVAAALARIGYRRVALRSRESPEFAATVPTPGGPRKIGIEVTELVHPSSARWRNAIANVDAKVREAIDADPTLQAAISGWIVCVGLHRCPDRAAEPVLVSELLALLRNGLASGRPAGRVDERLPALARHEAIVASNASRGSRGIVVVQPGATSFDPWSLAPVARDRLALKRKRARTYDLTAPIWLIISLTDDRGVFGASLSDLRDLKPAIDPYERVTIDSAYGSATWADR